MTSPDGVSWTLRGTDGIGLYSITSSEELGMFFAVDGSGSSNLYSSIDGVNWRRNQGSANYYTSVVWSKETGMFLACSQGDGRSSAEAYNNYPGSVGITRSGLDRFGSSLANGSNALGSGTHVIVPTPGYYLTLLTSVCFSPPLGVYVAVASSGTGNRVVTSP
jgi:hypothetical protein